MTASTNLFNTLFNRNKKVTLYALEKCLNLLKLPERSPCQYSYRTTSFSALSSFSATPRLVPPPKTKKCVIVRPLVYYNPQYINCNKCISTN